MKQVRKMDEMHRKGIQSAKVIEVIQTQSVIGSGVAADPYRIVVRYWDFKGNLLAEYDDWEINQERVER